VAEVYGEGDDEVSVDSKEKANDGSPANSVAGMWVFIGAASPFFGAFFLSPCKQFFVFLGGGEFPPPPDHWFEA
jgi:heme/copper-type cytochrome/quinol oxidase subunit 3